MNDEKVGAGGGCAGGGLGGAGGLGGTVIFLMMLFPSSLTYKKDCVGSSASLYNKVNNQVMAVPIHFSTVKKFAVHQTTRKFILFHGPSKANQSPRQAANSHLGPIKLGVGRHTVDPTRRPRRPGKGGHGTAGYHPDSGVAPVSDVHRTAHVNGDIVRRVEDRGVEGPVGDGAVLPGGTSKCRQHTVGIQLSNDVVS